MSSKHTQCAQAILDTIPQVMRAIRTEMRSHRDATLTIPQFRALLYIRRQPGSSLTQVADHLGLTHATTSRLIEGMVKQQYILRNAVAGNRRQINLTLTPSGKTLLESAMQKTRQNISAAIADFSESDCSSLLACLQMLHQHFSTEMTN